MDNILEKIRKDLQIQLYKKNKLIVAVLRMLISAIHNKEITLRKQEEFKLSDEQIFEIIRSEIKKRKDSVQAYEQGNRQDLVQKEKKEIEILEKYLPAQMSDEELRKIVKEIIEAAGEDKNFGKIMGQVMGKTKGLADGQRVSALVKKVLESDS